MCGRLFGFQMVIKNACSVPDNWSTCRGDTEDRQVKISIFSSLFKFYYPGNTLPSLTKHEHESWHHKIAG